MHSQEILHFVQNDKIGFCNHLRVYNNTNYANSMIVRVIRIKFRQFRIMSYQKENGLLPGGCCSLINPFSSFSVVLESISHEK